MEKKHILIANSTLAATYGAVSGYLDLSNNIGQVTLYIGYLAGTTADVLHAGVRYSPDNTLYFRQCSNDPDTAKIDVYATDFKFTDTSGTTEDFVTNEIVGNLNSVDNDGTQTYTSNSARLQIALPPATSTTPVIRHNGTAFGTVTEKANNAAFTDPASLTAGTVEWSLATGDLNFSKADLASYNGQEITIDYETKYNLIRIPLDVNDNYVKVALKETAAGGHGKAFCYVTYGPNFKR